MTYDVTTILFVAACVGVGGAAIYYLFIPGAGAPKPAARSTKRPRAASPPSNSVDSAAEQLAALRARVEAPEKPSDEVLALNGEPEIEWAESGADRVGPTLAERLAQAQEASSIEAERAKGPSPIAPWDLKGAEPSHESLAEALKASAAAGRIPEPESSSAESASSSHLPPAPPAPPRAESAGAHAAPVQQPMAEPEKPSGAVFLKGVKPRVAFAQEELGSRVLPAEAPVAVAAVAGERPLEDAISAIQPRGRLLLVDDSKVVRVKTEKLLLLAGYEVTTAVDGYDALEKLGGALPDIVITDIEMPNLDGFGLIKAMQESESLAGLPVIVMTSHIRLHLDIAATQGVVGFLPKPFDDQDLLDQVSHLLES